MDTERFLSMLEETLEITQGTLRGSDDLRTVENWHAETILQLVEQVEAEFGVALRPADVGKCPTVFELILLVDNRLAIH